MNYTNFVLQGMYLQAKLDCIKTFNEVDSDYIRTNFKNKKAHNEADKILKESIENETITLDEVWDWSTFPKVS